MDDQFAKLRLENQICFPLYALSRLTTKAYGPLLEQLDLTYPQYLVLLVLWERDQQPVQAIGARLLLESNTLTPLLKRMEEKALITRQRDKNDERSVIIALTDKARALQEQALCVPDAILANFSAANSDISAAEVANFQQTLHKLLRLFHS